MKWKLPWIRHRDGERQETKERLEAVQRDDVKIDRLTRRADRLVHENNLGPAVMKALGVQRR